MNRLALYILSLLIVSSCTSHDELLDYALEQAGDNRPELEKVLSHYADDPQKLEAARWLIANMPGHSVMWSEGMQAFADSVMHHRLNQERGNQLWDSLQKISSQPVKCRDLETLSAEFLIDNIEKSFKIWHESPWRDEVDFDRFKKYVLPYRSDNEMLRIGWRDSLSQIYAPVMDGASTAREAFGRLRKAVNSVRRNGKYNFPYIMDAVAMHNHYSGDCLERCVYLVAVCRTFGLPFTITQVPVFHNTAVIESSHPYRYIRVIADLPSYANMDRLDIYDCFGNLLASEKKRMIDLGAPHKAGRIDYFPWNDGNFVVPGHDYELVYWNHDRWQPISRQHSTGYSLVFDSIPQGVLLMLHDHTEGKEVRPFTLQNEKQIWW